MKRPGTSALTLVLGCLAGGCAAPGRVPTDVDRQVSARAVGLSAGARRVHREAIVIDTHLDTPQRMFFDRAFRLEERHTDGHVDLPRLREGGLDAAFFSIWVPTSVERVTAIRRASSLIDLTEQAVRANPDALVLATSAADIRAAAASGRIAILLGMEGGHLIDANLDLLRSFAARGIRYLTLTHSANTPWADSSGAVPEHGGLTPFGREVVRELNRLGVMVDVSHVSDATFWDVVGTTQAPLLASHSSARSLSDHPRNMTDDMLRAVARGGGVVMINFFVTFLDDDYRRAAVPLPPSVGGPLLSVQARCGDDEACSILGTDAVIRGFMRAGVLPPVSWTRILDHIDHVVRVAGIDHVGLGSDFDGATMPIGMEDVSHLPRITDALLRRGYSEADVRKILGSNLLRVMSQVEAVARQERRP